MKQAFAVVLFILVFISSCSKKSETTNDEISLDPISVLNELVSKSDYFQNMAVDFEKNRIEITFKPKPSAK